MSEPTAVEFGRMHRSFLQEHRPDVFARLQADKSEGGLSSYLSSVGQQAKDRYDTILAQSSNAPDVQNLPYHDRVKALQSLPETANEIVLHEIVFQPAPPED